jgi:hypothetical protein
MKRCPYTFPARTRKAMLAYLEEHEHYWPMNSNNGGRVLAWNVKLYNVDNSGRAERWARVYKIKPRDLAKEFGALREERDEAWRTKLDEEPDLFWHVVEDASRMYLEGEWTNYPGIEQGEWKFFRNGRSGGYFCLEDAPDWLPKPRGWACCRMTWDSKADYIDWLQSLPTDTLRRFYRAIRVLDHDLRREAVEAEFSYQLAFQRVQWEEDLNREEYCNARQQEEARPDLYVLTSS